MILMECVVSSLISFQKEQQMNLYEKFLKKFGQSKIQKMTVTKKYDQITKMKVGR